MFLGIEIGGTKLQLGLGHGDGHIAALWRGTVDAAAGGEGIRRQIVAAVPELLAKANADRTALRGVGVGFGGPTDDATQSVVKSHHVAGWDGFPLAAWVSEVVGVPAVICNDADVAGLGEALFGAGKGLSPIFYVTVGTGVGGGLIVDGEIYRGVGRGAAEVGHMHVGVGGETVEHYTAGPGIARMARDYFPLWVRDRGDFPLRHLVGDEPDRITAKAVAQAAQDGDKHAAAVIAKAARALGSGLLEVVTLLCPRCIVIGGGVALMGEDLFFRPLREFVVAHTFPPFVGLTDIVPAALGEEVVVHGALAMARKKFGVGPRL